MKRLFVVFLSLTVFSCQKEKEPLDLWDANQLAQLIASDKDWEQEYSDANIVTDNKSIDGSNAESTIKTLYPETVDELVVVYQGDQPQYLYWNTSGQWTTPYGTVGDPIGVIETANGAPISFYGLGYDLPGKVKIDQGQLAGKNITFAVRPTSDIIPTEYYSYNSFNASAPESQELKLFITRVQIEIPSKPVAAAAE